MPDADEELGVIRAEDIGEKWPLTVPWVLATGHQFDVASYRLSGITITTPAGARCAMNGSTKAHLGFPLLESTDPVWADRPTVGGLKRDIPPLTKRLHVLAGK
jgi:hypothetical protein